MCKLVSRAVISDMGLLVWSGSGKKGGSRSGSVLEKTVGSGQNTYIPSSLLIKLFFHHIIILYTKIFNYIETPRGSFSMSDHDPGLFLRVGFWSGFFFILKSRFRINITCIRNPACEWRRTKWCIEKHCFNTINHKKMSGLLSFIR